MGSETTDFYSSRYYYTSEIVFLLCRLPFIVISWYTRSILTSRLYRVLLIRNSKIRTKKLKIFQSIILIACNKVFVLQFLVNYIKRLSIYSLMLENFIWNKYIWYLILIALKKGTLFYYSIDEEEIQSYSICQVHPSYKQFFIRLKYIINYSLLYSNRFTLIDIVTGTSVILHFDTHRNKSLFRVNKSYFQRIGSLEISSIEYNLTSRSC